MADITQYTIDSSTLQSAQDYLIQFLRDSGFTGSTDDGTALYDTVIKPMSLLLTLFQQDLARSRAYLSLAEAEALKDTLGDEYDDVVDSILSNFFVSRKDGTKAKASLRLYFSTPMEFLSIPQGVSIASYEDTNLLPVQEYSFYSGDFTALINAVEDTLMYYVDVEVESEDVLTLPESLVEASSVEGQVSGLYFLKAEMVRIIDTGSGSEASEDFIARTEAALTTRELVTAKAYLTVLQEEFAAVKAVYVAGHGDPEQVRDIVAFDAMSIHVGNKVDVFVKSGISEITETLVCDTAAVLRLQQKGILQILSLTDSSTGTELPWSAASADSEKTASLSDALILAVPSLAVGTSIEIKYLASTNLASITDYVQAVDQRNSCCDVLIKEKFPVTIGLELQITALSSAFVTETEDSVADKIKATAVSFIKGCNTAADFSVSALLSKLHATHDFITQVTTPVTAPYVLVDPDGFSEVTGVVDSRFTIPHNLSDQVSENTIQFYSSAENIQITWM